MKYNILLLLMTIFLNLAVYSQDYYRPIDTELNFLDFSLNTRIGAFGEIGVVSSSFYKDAGLYQNPSLLSKNDRYTGGNYSYAPWLAKIVDNSYLKECNGYYAFNTRNSVGYNFKYFYLGDVELRDMHGNFITITKNAREQAHQFNYAHSFNKHLGVGLGLKYIKSDYGYDISNGGYNYKPVNTFALDIGAEYSSSFNISGKSFLNYHIGGAISNFGPKIKSSDDPDEKKKFIPATLRIGFLFNPDFSLSNNLKLSFDIAYQAEKYLVPSTPVFSDTLTVIVKGKSADISSFQAVYQSFYDAPDGGKEELHEIMHRLGTEIRMNYNDKYYLAFRFGKFMIHQSKGQGYDTFGFGIGVYGFSLDYKKINSRNSILDDTWALSLGFRTRLDNFFSF